VNKAFSTPIHFLTVNGARHIANMRDPQFLPRCRRSWRESWRSNDFRPHRMSRLRPKYTFKVGGNTYEAVVPADLAKIYNFNPLFAAGISGKGQTIAVIEDSNLYRSADWTTFRSVFGLSSYTAGTLDDGPPEHADESWRLHKPRHQCR
jgi:hypothetical protein